MQNISIQDAESNPILNSLVAPYLSPGVGLQQEQAQVPLTQQEQATSAQSAATSGQEQQNLQAQNSGIQAQSQTDVIQALQKKAQLGLSSDLQNKMTLPSALKKYTALGMNPDAVFNQYLAESPWGMPNQNPQELQEMGVSAKALGDIGTPGSFMDRYNTKNAISGLRNLEDLWNKTSNISRLPILGDFSTNVAAYNTAKTAFGEHLSSLIPGGSNSGGSVQSLTDSLPDPKDLGEDVNGKASAQFSALENQLLTSKGYTSQSLGLTPRAPQPSSKSGNLLSGLLQTAVPTVGAVGGGLAGGGIGALFGGAGAVPGAVGGSIAGGAGGQALADLLTGKKPGADVAVTGALSGVGEGVGAGVAGLLSKGGATLASKVPDNIFDKVVAASPNYMTDLATLKNTANKYGLMTGSTKEGLQKMPSVMSDIGKKIQTLLSSNNEPIPLNQVSKSIQNDFSKQTSVFEDSQDFKNAQQYIKDRLYSATGNGSPLSKILGSNGQSMENKSAQATYSNLYQLKGEVANDLKPVFKAQANPNLTTNFTPKQEANLALWSGLKNVIDGASPEIRTLNDDQHNMFDIAKGFVKNGTKSGGSGALGDIFDVLAGNMVGGLPGALIGGIGGKIARSEGTKVGTSNFLQSKALQQGLKSTGAGLGSGLGALLGM